MRLYKNTIITIIASLIATTFFIFPTFAEDVDYNVNIAPALTLTTSTNSLALNLDPSSKTFDSKNLMVSVGTNNKTGYTLTLSTPNDNTDLDRNSSGDSISAVLPTLSSGTYTESTFTPDRWGYKINSNTSIPSTITTDYIPFVSGNTLMESAIAVNNDQTELTFAAKVDYLQPAGTYATTLNFNIVANPEVDYIQDLNPALCTTTPMTVVDKRDGEEYTIQRLADGNCWLLDNLRLDISDPAVQAKLNSTTTNATDEILNYLINGGGSSPYPASGVSSIWTSSSQDSYTLPYIITTYKDTMVTTKYGIGSGKIGIYYNFCAASAGSYCYAVNASSGNSQYDICPHGWRLPTGDTTNGSYYYLYNTGYSSNITNFNTALSIPLSGYFFSGSDSFRDTRGYFWSSTRYNGNGMYQLVASASAATPQNPNNRYYGFSVRCILNDTRTISDITNMQDITPGIVSRTADGATATLKDIRDNQQYTVAKINGNVWMTRNLAIGCNGTGSNYGSTMVSKALTPTNTNIASNFSTPTASLTLGDSGTDARMECSSTYGAWYNFVTATGGTITNSTITQDAVYDICPFGWKMPTYSDASGISSYTSQFQPVNGSNYAGGSIDPRTRGIWWFATRYSNTKRRYMYSENGAALRIDGSDADLGFGFYLRCIAK